jgi:peptidoglycan/LPS O-acetylase OafA/YrhL
MQPTHKYLSNLTPLRAIAAICVVFYHFQSVIAVFVLPERTRLLDKGYLMVDLFFIMSGFIISHVYHQSFQSGLSAGNVRRFIVARFARVYPLHLITLLILILFAALVHGWGPIFDPNAILTNILLIHAFGIQKVFTWNVPSWSISAEWWAYMAFPFLAILLYRQKKLVIVLMSLLVILSYLAIMFWLPRKDPFDPTAIVPHNLDSTFDYGFLRGIAGFVTGMLLYALYEPGLLRKMFQKDITAVILILGTLTCLHFGINDGFYIILFAGVVFTFALNNGKLHSFCNFRFMQYLGKISYSIYLMQVFPLLPFFGGVKLPGLRYAAHSATVGFWLGSGYCLIYVGIVIGLSSITYYSIEKPCRKLINAKWGKETMPVYA